MNEQEILVIDDEAQMRKLLGIIFESGGYRVTYAATGKEGISMVASRNPALVILDIGLPDQSGHEVLRKIRESYTKPVMILSVQDSEEDIVSALDNGANDYLVKPFRTGELLARVRSCLRNTGGERNASPVIFRNLEIDLINHLVKKNDAVLKLTATEFSLLALFARNEGKVLTHRSILKEVWGASYIYQTQYLRVFVAQLRKKIEDDPDHPQFILTESGIGYRFVAAE